MKVEEKRSEPRDNITNQVPSGIWYNVPLAQHIDKNQKKLPLAIENHQNMITKIVTDIDVRLSRII